MALDLDRLTQLVAAAVESPHDDAPRLVLADHLTDRGDPRGELIQLQCSLARMTADAPGRAALVDRERAILEAHGAAWTAPFLPVVGAAFTRGLVSSLHRSPTQLGKERAILEASLPRFGVERLILRGATKRVAALADTSALAWAPELRWYDCQLDDASLATFVRSPHLHRVSTLILEKLRCGDTGLLSLAEGLPRLQALELPAPTHGGAFTTPGLIALLEAAPRIRGLRVDHAYRVRFEVLAESPVLAQLRSLEMGTTSTEGARAIVGSPHVGGLHALVLDPITPVDDTWLDVALGNPALAGLRHLSFRRPLREALDERRVEALRARFGAALRIAG